MNWADGYNFVSDWCFNHQLETDLIIVGGVLWGVFVVLRKQRRRRRRLSRLLRGATMRADRKNLQRMRFEDALTDTAMEMIHEGWMNDAEEKMWFNLFGSVYEFTGLLPAKQSVEGLKKAINKRISKLQLAKKMPLVAPYLPAQVDKSYQPNIPIHDGLINSKYLKD